MTVLPRFTELTAIEKRHLELLAAGFDHYDAARALYVTAATVKFHRHNVYRKLRARNATHAVHLGHVLGLLDADTV